MRAGHAPAGVPPHALFRWRVRSYTVAGDTIPESISMRLRVVVIPRWRVASNNVRGRGGSSVKRLPTFLSLLHVQVQESPPYLHPFHFSPLSFNFVSGPDFKYISFDFVQWGPPIGIDAMSIFQFGPPFNFQIGLKNINLFGTVFLISLFLSFD